MIKLRDIKFTKDALLLTLCVLGTVAVAWWAYIAGPVQSSTALSGAAQTSAAQGLGAPYYSGASGAPGYGNSAASSLGGQSGSGGASSAASAATPQSVPPLDQPLYPLDPTPSLCKSLPGIQPYGGCPYNCGAIRYPCCQYLGGAQSLCGCGGQGTELLCASPL